VRDDAQLVIVESWEDVPLKGGCSAHVTFDAGALIGTKYQQQLTLEAMFVHHYRLAHESFRPKPRHLSGQNE